MGSTAAGPSRMRYPATPFVSKDHRPESPDGKFRVTIVSTGSVASIKLPDIVRELSRNPHIEVQIVSTKPSRHFYSQEQIDNAVLTGRGVGDGTEVDDDEIVQGVKIWADEDEWSDWRKLGDPILHIELRRWADMVVVAPCSADFLAKLAAGFSDNLALSMMRALTPATPVIVCPAMNTHMYQHPLTEDHLRILQSRLGYMISGPQGIGMLACGDEGPGKMTDWRDIVNVIENFASKYLTEHPITLSRPNQNKSKQTTKPPSTQPDETSVSVLTPPHPYPIPTNIQSSDHVAISAPSSSFQPSAIPKEAFDGPAETNASRRKRLNSNELTTQSPPSKRMAPPGLKNGNDSEFPVQVQGNKLMENRAEPPFSKFHYSNDNNHIDYLSTDNKDDNNTTKKHNQNVGDPYGGKTSDIWLYNTRPVPATFIGETSRPLSNGNAVGGSGPTMADMSALEDPNKMKGIIRHWRTTGNNGGDGYVWTKWWTG